ncbi:putative flavonol synthase [Elasticomyces elasticus]|uniref:Flavonol synthase n=1 Tax=Elasticomyces elasticus TaxID=574655 RepID=A0AAN7W7M0_9PEZI|nr:putative flavonol synthase [Elasticomyces elasticus]
MPSSTLEIPRWARPRPTQDKLDYVDLARIDLSKWPAQKEELVDDLRKAVTEVGFWLVENTGITDEEVVRQHSIGNAFLDLPLEYKRQHPCDFKNGNFFGFREGFRLMGDTNVKDNSEALCLPKITPSMAHEFPDFKHLEPFKSEIEAFQKKIHERVLTPLLKLFALLLELPEDYFAGPHAWNRPSEDHLRYMRYIPNSAETDALLPEKQYLNGHTDFGVLTLLFAQVVQGLQIRTDNGEWKHVPYIPNTMVVNTADILSFATGGYLQSTIHRVIRPPEDQANIPRLGVFYFGRAAHDWEANKIVPSPVLERLGIYKPDEESAKEAVTGLDFTRARVKHTWDRKVYGDDAYNKGFEHEGLMVRTNYEAQAA